MRTWAKLELINRHNDFDKIEIDEYGDKFYRKNDLLHRLNGPAIEYVNGTKAYCINDKLHRLDGPAIEFANGDKQYWIDGQQLTKEQFDGYIKRYYKKRNINDRTRTMPK